MVEWHAPARAMRAEGQTLEVIAKAFGVTRQRVHQVCRGVAAPPPPPREPRIPKPRGRPRKYDISRKERYRNDPVYRERCKEQSLATYYRRKAQREGTQA